ncbi:unnamed protein product [Cyprideis torosa]|uniref:L-aspartate oxidase n=1 Tax=Cyprideis torosa TaxID=163714 RepID=A0A7R8ZTY0_9CRUS|nr:unnamed protein product [Cyprideis torosa]CAG0908205.1 unnamed protein product [Cyprideis torosa]
MTEADILVLGSGVSGLTYAIHVAQMLPDKKIVILTKGDLMDSNTKWAQGGISVVLDLENDSFEKHIQDTLIAGDGLCDEEVVRYVVREGPKRFKEMVDWGAEFDREEDGDFSLGREGGHTENRVAHHKDITGYEIERTLAEKYYQFHPTALYGISNPAFLISEAVRGFGAKLRTISGERFMHHYDPREELASRDIVARAIDNELKTSGAPYVTLDCRHLEREEFLQHFPNIYETCLKIGIDCFKDPIPVVPAAHYMCGGVMVDIKTQTSLENLLAIGEVTSSGLHGANRLASNSVRVSVRTIPIRSDIIARNSFRK